MLILLFGLLLISTPAAGEVCADCRQSVSAPISDAVQACLPERIHPVSQQYLDAFLEGHIPRAQFLRSFSLPNSDYLPVQQCIIAAIDAPAEID